MKFKVGDEVAIIKQGDTKLDSPYLIQRIDFIDGGYYNFWDIYHWSYGEDDVCAPSDLSGEELSESRTWTNETNALLNNISGILGQMFF